MKYSLYKNEIHLRDFNTIKDCSEWLKNIIGEERKLDWGLSRIKNGLWKPKSGALHGYSLKENQTVAETTKMTAEEFMEAMNDMENGERVKLLNMLYNERFNNNLSNEGNVTWDDSY